MIVNKNIEVILRAREERAKYQKKLIQKYHKTLIAFKLNIPGPMKDTLLYRRIFTNGLDLLKFSLKEHKITIVFEKWSFKNTGPEAFLVVDCEAQNIKILCTKLEESDGLGRIYDFDVIDSYGKSIGRGAMGISERSCFLCDEYVWICARNRTHSIKEMLEFIEKTAKTYFINK